MAEVSNMGEVDEIPAKDDGIVVNGLSNDIDMESQNSQDEESVHTKKDATSTTMMDVDEKEDDESSDEEEKSNNEEAQRPNDNDDEEEEDEDDEVSDEENAVEATGSVEEDGNSQGIASQSDNHDEDEEEDDTQVSTSDNIEKSHENIEENSRGDKSSKQTSNINDQSNDNEEDEEEEVEDEEEEDDEVTSVTSESGSQTSKQTTKEDENSRNQHDNTTQDVVEIVDKEKVTASTNNSNSSSSNHSHNSALNDKRLLENGETIELHDSGGESQREESDDDDVMVVENGTTEIIDLDETPEPDKPESSNDGEEKTIDSEKEVIAPRRSTRNLHKKKSYAESEKEDTPPPLKNNASTPGIPVIRNIVAGINDKKVEDSEEDEDEEESDIEEVLPTDPLAVNSDAITVERIPMVKSVKNNNVPKSIKSSNNSGSSTNSSNNNKPAATSTIVVKDTKRLVEIATSKSSTPATTVGSGKKEPTLVIIDTNSILSGRGPVPVNKSIASTNYTSVLPMAVPAQGIYPPNMRATITPIPINAAGLSSHATSVPKTSPATITPASLHQATTPLLPTLTDDMYVVEAPSFIVPYVYEKPPVKDFKEFIKDMKTELLKSKKKKKTEAKESKTKKRKAKKETEDGEEGGSEEGEDDSDDSFHEESENEEDDDEDEEVEEEAELKKGDEVKKPYSYFESPLGKFFIDIGYNMVQEHVQNDLLKQQKRKRDRESGTNPETNKTIQSLMKNLEYTKENNEHFKMAVKKCEFCNFKTESSLAMSYHLETPHMKNFVYKCNFCPYEIRSPHDILFHMEAEHAVRGHLERAPAFHQCPNCPFEDNQKGKLSRHLVACMRKFKPERNLEPPVDWEPPAKIPRVPRTRAQGLNATAAAYQALTKNNQYQLLTKMQMQTVNALQRGRGRPTLPTMGGPLKTQQQTVLRPGPGGVAGMIFKQQAMAGGSVLLPANYHQMTAGGQVYQNAVQVTKKPSSSSSQPSISITPLPRGPSASSTNAAGAAAAGTPPSTMTAKPGDTNSKNMFVICEICDGYIKDLEQLRNHMQWIHKIKIHPKMIYNRPPLNCQKCQFRFFTDQGLERHLLGSHGLVTSSMQEAANKSKDSGRCPVCGRVYQWKLLNHVARDHHMVLKPAHLSYKCTVCTATFGMYKQFENHVYSAHSVVAKRVMDKKASTTSTTTTSSSSTSGNKSSQQAGADIKPLKINDEITIIPQPAKSSTSSSTSNGTNSKSSNKSGDEAESTSTGAASRAERLARRNATETETE